MNKVEDRNVLLRALDREKKARRQAEEILEIKSAELYHLTQELKHLNERLENTVKERTAELQGLFDNMLDAYIILDRKGRIIRANNAAKKMLGYDAEKEEVYVSDIVHHKDKQRSKRYFKKLLNEGKYLNYEGRVYTKNGEIRYVNVNSNAIYKNGEFAGSQDIVRDITHRKEAEEALAESQNQLGLIFDNSPVGIVLMRFGTFIKTNKAFQKLLGYTEAELLKKKIVDIAHSEKSKLVAFSKKMDKGETDHFEVKKKYVKKNGSLLWAKTNVSAVRDQWGNIKYQIGIVEDITERVKAEKRREYLLKTLEKSNQELEEFAYVVSHDLKSPLRSISALTSWIFEDNPTNFDEDTQKNINLLLDTVDKMEDLINGILEYSSIGKTDTNSTKINIETLVKGVLNIIFVPDNIQIRITSKLPVIKADKHRMEQLFMNLINNAVPHINKKEGLIEIACEDAKNHWQFSIRDNGKGIDKKYHKKIFKVFQTLDTNKKRTGIGLSIVKKIVEFYGGNIWLESEINKGTIFYFTIRKNNKYEGIS